MGIVAVRQCFLGNLIGTADTLGHLVAGHFKVDTARVAALGLVNFEEAFHLMQDGVDVACLIAV